MDLFCGGHVEHSRKRHIRVLRIMLPINQIFISHPRRSNRDASREKSKPPKNESFSTCGTGIESSCQQLPYAQQAVTATAITNGIARATASMNSKASSNSDYRSKNRS